MLRWGASMFLIMVPARRTMAGEFSKAEKMTGRQDISCGGRAKATRHHGPAGSSDCTLSGRRTRQPPARSCVIQHAAASFGQYPRQGQGRARLVQSYSMGLHWIGTLQCHRSLTQGAGVGTGVSTGRNHGPSRAASMVPFPCVSYKHFVGLAPLFW